jgi:hypothetical protein
MQPPSVPYRGNTQLVDTAAAYPGGLGLVPEQRYQRQQSSPGECDTHL